MKIIDWSGLGQISTFKQTKTALTVGVFDGVHLGHRKLIERLVADKAKLLPVVVTFRQNPKAYLKANSYVKDIICFERKIEIFKELGVKIVVAIDFSEKFSKMSAIDFFNLLTQSFLLKKIITGKNFYFGRDREASNITLAKWCAKKGAYLEVVNTVQYKGRRVSSTRIRHCILEGRLAEVRAMLLSDFKVSLPGDEVGYEKNEFCKLAKRKIAQLVPQKGAFRCRFETENNCFEGQVKINEEFIELENISEKIKSIIFCERLS